MEVSHNGGLSRMQRCGRGAAVLNEGVCGVMNSPCKAYSVLQAKTWEDVPSAVSLSSMILCLEVMRAVQQCTN
jgi:hypothetical protein